VAQNIGNLLERTAALDQAARQGMAKCMRAGVRQADSAAGSFDDLLNGRRCDGLIAPVPTSHEEGGMAGGWAFMLEIVGQCLPVSIGNGRMSCRSDFVP
jgi:hypothetical protein